MTNGLGTLASRRQVTTMTSCSNDTACAWSRQKLPNPGRSGHGYHAGRIRTRRRWCPWALSEPDAALAEFDRVGGLWLSCIGSRLWALSGRAMSLATPIADLRSREASSCRRRIRASSHGIGTVRAEPSVLVGRQARRASVYGGIGLQGRLGGFTSPASTHKRDAESGHQGPGH